MCQSMFFYTQQKDNLYPQFKTVTINYNTHSMSLEKEEDTVCNILNINTWRNGINDRIILLQRNKEQWYTLQNYSSTYPNTHYLKKRLNISFDHSKYFPAHETDWIMHNSVGNRLSTRQCLHRICYFSAC